MAVVQLNPLAENLSGKLSRKGATVLRKKQYRSPSGKVIAEASQEAYEILHPRDYTKHPPRGTELANISSFAEASRLTTAIIRSGQYTEAELSTMPDDERNRIMDLRAQFKHFQTRFEAQLRVPDPQAPLLKKSDADYNPNSAKPQHRRYRSLNAFIRVMLLQSIRQNKTL